MKCEKCEKQLNEDDFFISKYLKCVHSTFSEDYYGWVGKYDCRSCGYCDNKQYKIKNENKCKSCIIVKNKIKNSIKPKDENYDYFIACDENCKGHWLKNDCMNECFDCKTELDEYNCIYHCCCKN